MTIDELKALVADCGSVDVVATPGEAVVTGIASDVTAARMTAYAVIAAVRGSVAIVGPPGVVNRGEHAFFEVHIRCDFDEAVIVDAQ